MIDRLMYLYDKELKELNNDSFLNVLDVSLKELMALNNAYELVREDIFNKNDLEKIKALFEEKLSNAKKNKKFKMLLNKSNLILAACVALTFLMSFISPFEVIKYFCLSATIVELSLSGIFLILNFSISKTAKELYNVNIALSEYYLDDVEKVKKVLEIAKSLDLTEKRVSGKQEEKKKTYPLIEEKDGSYLISYASTIEKHFDINTSCEQVKSYVGYFFKYIPDLSEKNLVNVLKNINSRFIEEIVIESENVVASLGEEDNGIKEKVSSLKKRLDSFSYIVELIKIVNAINMRNLDVKRQLKQK